MSRLYGLDALRGIAALFVAAHHLLRVSGFDSPIATGLAVDVFFILSGFVMTRTYEPKLRAGMTTPRFLRLRYKRLVLSFAVGSFLGAIAALLMFGPSWHLFAAFALILAFLPAFWLPSAFIINVPAWSLFLELVANAAHGAIFARQSTRSLLFIWLAATLAFIGAVFAGHAEWGPSIGEVLWLLPRALSCYLCGILLYRHFGDEPFANQPLTALTALCVLLLVADASPMVEVLATLVAAPIIVRASLALQPSAWAAGVGALSYPLYATHAPVTRLFSGLPIGLNFALMLIFAVAVTVFVEGRRPARPSTLSRGDALKPLSR